MWCIQIPIHSFILVIDGNNLIRQTKSGPVLGEERRNSLKQDVNFYAFHGIPYASPPVGSLRFREPKEPDPFDELYDASNSSHDNKCCPQVKFNNFLALLREAIILKCLSLYQN